MTLSQKYFPAFSTRDAEQRAYTELGPDILNRIIPEITLTRERDAPSLQDSLDSVLQTAAGRQVIVNFDPNPRPIKTAAQIAEERQRKADERRAQGKAPYTPTANQEARFQRQRDITQAYNTWLAGLQSSTGGFAAWRAFTLAAPNVIPVVQMSDVSQIAAQVNAIKAADRQMAFHIDVTTPSSLTAFLVAAPHLDRADRAVLIFDAGYIRGAVADAEHRIINALSAVQLNLANLFLDMVKVCMAGSFPGYLANLTSPLDIEERALYDRVTAAGWDVRYGDYSAVQPRSAQAGGAGYYAHVEVAHARQWHFRRSDKKSVQSEFITCSRDLVNNSVAWQGRCASWGTDMVERASQGRLDDGRRPPESFGSAGKWVGPRVNQHITQQALHP